MASIARSITGRPITLLGRSYILMLSIALLGYALGGRGFAYLGFPPIFIGEITLAIGIAAMIQSGRATKTLQLSHFLPLILFMVWGALRTMPYFGPYGVNAIRDAVIWGYGMFAIVTAALLIAVPEYLSLLVKWFSRFVVIYLIAMPALWLISRLIGGEFPANPMTGVPFIEIKGGDTCVQLAGMFVFLVTMGGSVNPWVGPLLIPLNLGMNLHGRAGMLSFAIGVFLAMLLKPFSERAWRIFGVMILGLVLLWATDFKVGDVGGGREISFDYVTRAVTSVLDSKSSDEDLQGTKRWRLMWWTDIIDYTIHGKYFWTGKGFGISLADDDGYQIDGTLRSPHNGHLTVLARSGVPGFSLWIISHIVFAITMVKLHLQARRRRDWKWAGLFLCLLAYWAALMTNASFDVFLEGPMGGVWLWSIYGIGIASAVIFRRWPEVLYLDNPLLTPPQDVTAMPPAPIAPARRPVRIPA